MINAILLDVDGTLIDSNDQHAQSWAEVLAANGHPVPFEEIRRLIGMGGDKLLSTTVRMRPPYLEFFRMELFARLVYAVSFRSDLFR